MKEYAAAIILSLGNNVTSLCNDDGDYILSFEGDVYTFDNYRQVERDGKQLVQFMEKNVESEIVLEFDFGSYSRSGVNRYKFYRGYRESFEIKEFKTGGGNVIHKQYISSLEIDHIDAIQYKAVILEGEGEITFNILTADSHSSWVNFCGLGVKYKYNQSL